MRSSLSTSMESRTVVAACPTFHYMLEVLEKEGFDVVKTSSTSESIKLFLKEETDFFISGRRLKPSEPSPFFKILGPGFSLLASHEIVILEEEMEKILFYTDLDLEEILEKFPFLQNNLLKVEDIYEYLNKGVLITSVENTDYRKAEPVHVLGPSGKRSRFSRTPLLYYSKEEHKTEEIVRILRED